MRILPAALSLLACALLAATGCTTGVESSPEPGVLRITLKSVETDTMIVIRGDTSKFSRWDRFDNFVSQGRLYQGENYAALYNNPTSDRKTSDTANILSRQWLNGNPITPQDTAAITPQNSRYVKFVIFESYAPPGTYDRVSLALTANEMEVFYPQYYLNPVTLPPGTTPSIDFPVSITLQEGKVTEVALEVYPFQSLERVRDAYYYNRKMLVTGVTVQ